MEILRHKITDILNNLSKLTQEQLNPCEASALKYARKYNQKGRLLITVLPVSERHVSFIPDEGLSFAENGKIKGFYASEDVGNKDEPEPVLYDYPNLEAYRQIHPGVLVALRIRESETIENLKDLKRYSGIAWATLYFNKRDGTEDFYLHDN